MSTDTSAFGFGKFIPGFDFLQGLARAGKEASASPLSSWVAPTVSVEEISKRIEELKAVQFWLEQNSRALAATVQALEVQKMTLSTLQGMNVSMADLAKSFTGQAAAAGAANPFAAAQQAAAASSHADWPMSSKSASAASPASTASAAAAQAKSAPPAAGDKAQASAPPDSDAAAQAKASKAQDNGASGATSGAGAAAGIDPMQWWGALTQQFQHIAAQALQDPAQQQAMAQATHMATDFTKAAMKAAGDMVRSATEAAQASAASATAAPAAKKPAASKSTSATSKAAPRAAAPKAGTAARKSAAKPAVKSTRKPAGKTTSAKR